jgi:hypothetical protein
MLTVVISFCMIYRLLATGWMDIKFIELNFCLIVNVCLQLKQLIPGFEVDVQR